MFDSVNRLWLNLFCGIGLVRRQDDKSWTTCFEHSLRRSDMAGCVRALDGLGSKKQVNSYRLSVLISMVSELDDAEVLPSPSILTRTLAMLVKSERMRISNVPGGAPGAIEEFGSCLSVVLASGRLTPSAQSKLVERCLDVSENGWISHSSVSDLNTILDCAPTDPTARRLRIAAKALRSLRHSTISRQPQVGPLVRHGSELVARLCGQADLLTHAPRVVEHFVLTLVESCTPELMRVVRATVVNDLYWVISGVEFEIGDDEELIEFVHLQMTLSLVMGQIEDTFSALTRLYFLRRRWASAVGLDPGLQEFLAWCEQAVANSSFNHEEIQYQPPGGDPKKPDHKHVVHEWICRALEATKAESDSVLRSIPKDRPILLCGPLGEDHAFYSRINESGAISIGINRMLPEIENAIGIALSEESLRGASSDPVLLDRLSKFKLLLVRRVNPDLHISNCRSLTSLRGLHLLRPPYLAIHVLLTLLANGFDRVTLSGVDHYSSLLERTCSGRFWHSWLPQSNPAAQLGFGVHDPIESLLLLRYLAELGVFEADRQLLNTLNTDLGVYIRRLSNVFESVEEVQR